MFYECSAGFFFSKDENRYISYQTNISLKSNYEYFVNFIQIGKNLSYLNFTMISGKGKGGERL